MPTITVFTPAFNRKHTLPRTYESLLAQNCKDFIWLIIDDGSTDGTKALVEEWKKNNNGFSIRYIYKENGGMHTAHNVAYENIDTELNLCIDSDDKLAKNAIQLILDKWSKVKDKGYAGIIGLDADFNGNIVGDDLSGFDETTLSDYYATGRIGDKKLVYRTDIINSFPPYPVFEGEKYVALAYKYKLIDQKYQLAVLNEVLCDVEYQADGSSNTMWRQYYLNPKGFAFWRATCIKYPTSKKRLILDCIHYTSSCFLSKSRLFRDNIKHKCLILSMSPIGYILSLYIKLKNK